jgi:membrane protease YdiL (CAAX protease family)
MMYKIFKIIVVLMLTLPVSLFLSVLISQLLGIELIWLIFLLQSGITLSMLELGLKLLQEKTILERVLPSFTFKNYLKGVLTGSLFIILTHIYSIVFDQKLFFTQNHGYVLVFGCIFLLQSFVEEAIFRKFLVEEFQQLFKNRTLLSAVISGILFALVHLFSNAIFIDIVNLFLFGVFLALGYIFIESKSTNHGIWWTSGFHFAWNFTYFLLGIQYLDQSDSEKTLEPFMILNIMAGQNSFWVNKLMISFVLGFGILYLIYKQNHQTKTI